MLTVLKHVLSLTDEERNPGGSGGEWGLNPKLPVLFNPGSRPVFVGFRLFAFFRL